MVALKRENHDHSTDHVRSYDHSADHVRSYDDLRWDHRMFLKQIQRQKIWLENICNIIDPDVSFVTF